MMCEIVDLVVAVKNTGCNTMWSSINVPTFWKTVLPRFWL